MSELHGIDREGNLVTFYSFNPLTLELSNVEIHILRESLKQRWESIVEISYNEDKNSNKVRDIFEKRWRQDKSLKMSEEELRAYGLTYLCTVGGYHVSCCWVSSCNLAFDLTGERSCRVNAFHSDVKERAILIDQICWRLEI